jgi:hypothetical protein
MGCSIRPKADLLLQKTATDGLSAILEFGVLAGQVFTFGRDLRERALVGGVATG